MVNLTDIEFGFLMFGFGVSVGIITMNIVNSYNSFFS